MVRWYLDDCLIATAVVRRLRAAGLLVYVTTELGLQGQADQAHLERATVLGAVLAAQNDSDFSPLHHRWQAAGRRHAGILVTRQIRDVGTRFERLERAARLLSPDIPKNQLMGLDMFETEGAGPDLRRQSQSLSFHVRSFINNGPLRRAFSAPILG